MRDTNRKDPRLTKEEAAELARLVDELGVSAAARKFGVSYTTAKAWRELGKIPASKRPKPNSQMTKEENDTICRLFPDHTFKEIAVAIGRCYTTVKGAASRLGLKTTPEREALLRPKHEKDFAEAVTSPDFIARKRREARARARMERLRIESGRPQLTKQRYSILAPSTRGRLNRLVTHYHYFRSSDINSLRVYYDEETIRKPHVEAYSTEAYGITFHPAEGYEDTPPPLVRRLPEPSAPGAEEAAADDEAQQDEGAQS